MSALLEAARRYLEWNDQRWTYTGDLEEWQRLRDTIEAAESERPAGRHEQIEAIAAQLASDIAAQLYAAGESQATLSRARVRSALEDCAARAIGQWLDQAG